MAIKNSNSIFSSPFLKNVSKLFSANVIVGIVALLLAPVLTRLYAPEDFAAFGVFMTIVGILTIISTLRLEYAILLPKEDAKAHQLARLSLEFAFIISIISGVLLFFTKDFWGQYFETSNMGSWIWLIAPTVFFIAVFQIFTHLASREKNFSKLAVAQTTAGITNPLNKILFAMQNLSTYGLIAGYSVAQLIGAALLGKDHYTKLKASSIDEKKSLLSSYKEFPLYNLPHAFSNFLAGNLPYLMLIPIFGDYKMGLYTVVMMVAFKPISMLGSAIYQVLYQQTVSDYNNELPVFKDIAKLIKQMALIGIVPAIILCALAPLLFGWLFGDAYTEAGNYARLLAPWLFMVYLSSPLSFAPNIYKQQRQALLFDLLYLVLRFVALLIGIKLGSFTLALGLFSGVGTIMLLGYMFWIFYLLRNGDNK